MNKAGCTAFYVIALIILLVLTIMGLVWIFSDKPPMGVGPEALPTDRISRQIKGIGLVISGALAFGVIMTIAMTSKSLCRPDVGDLADLIVNRI